MPDSADHRVACYVASSERRKLGLPIWAHQVDLKDVFHNEALTFEQRRDCIVSRLRATSWLRRCDEDDYRLYVVSELADASDADEFDGWWDVLYDYADADRVWISTF